jgi:hypothetical protein
MNADSAGMAPMVCNLLTTEVSSSDEAQALRGAATLFPAECPSAYPWKAFQTFLGQPPCNALVQDAMLAAAFPYVCRVQLDTRFDPVSQRLTRISSSHCFKPMYYRHNSKSTLWMGGWTGWKESGGQGGPSPPCHLRNDTTMLRVQ